MHLQIDYDKTMIRWTCHLMVKDDLDVCMVNENPTFMRVVLQLTPQLLRADL